MGNRWLSTSAGVPWWEGERGWLAWLGVAAGGGGQGSGLGHRDRAEGREGANVRLPCTCCNPTDPGDRKTTCLACLLKLRGDEKEQTW